MKPLWDGPLLAALLLCSSSCAAVRATPGGPVTALALGGAQIETCSVPAEADRPAAGARVPLCVKVKGVTLSSAARGLLQLLLGGVAP